jgi:plasmid stabilization system protein ParE
MVEKVIITPKANNDLRDIIEWYDNQSYLAGDRFLDEFNYGIEKITASPSLYKFVAKDIQRCLLKIFPFIIYFSSQPEGIVVLRIRHKKQRMLSRFK